MTIWSWRISRNFQTSWIFRTINLRLYSKCCLKSTFFQNFGKSFYIFTFSWKGVSKIVLIWVNFIKIAMLNFFSIFDFFIFSCFFRSILIGGVQIRGAKTKISTPRSKSTKKYGKKWKNQKSKKISALRFWWSLLILKRFLNRHFTKKLKYKNFLWFLWFLGQHFEDNPRFTVRRSRKFGKFPKHDQLQMAITFLFMKRFW